MEISAKARITPPRGIVINDDIGNKYTTTSDSNIVKVVGVELKIIKSYGQRIAARRKTVRGKISKAQHPVIGMRKIKITESKG